VLVKSRKKCRQLVQQFKQAASKSPQPSSYAEIRIAAACDCSDMMGGKPGHPFHFAKCDASAFDKQKFSHSRAAAATQITTVNAVCDY
jgi:hypothetical protein